jgi:DNA primase small subunit
MKIDAESFLKSKIKEYYEKHPIEIEDLERREFGYGVYGKKIAGRHVEFQDNDRLNYFLRKKIPFYLSYSMAFYEKPDARPMPNKKIIKSDLVFEFDADDIPTDCKKKHDGWRCEKCGEHGKGLTKRCPSCSANVKTEEWICDECLDATKEQTIRLYNLFVNEFGFNKDELQIMYSGHKGYHLKIKSKRIENFKQPQRLELIDYITEEGINFKSLGFEDDNRGSLVFNKIKKGKAKEYLDLIEKTLKDKNIGMLSLMFGTSTLSIKKIKENLDEVLKMLHEGKFFKPKRNFTSNWYNFMNEIKEEKRLYIDRQTTIDIHKIIRAENTIHAGAMLVSKVIKDIEALKQFKPFEDASIYSKEEQKKTMKIKTKKIPLLLINGKEIGPFKDSEVIELPIQIGTYFIARNAAYEVVL